MNGLNHQLHVIERFIQIQLAVQLEKMLELITGKQSLQQLVENLATQNLVTLLGAEKSNLLWYQMILLLYVVCDL